MWSDDNRLKTLANKDARTPMVSDSGSEFGGLRFKFKFCYDNSLDLPRGGPEFKSRAMLLNS